MARPQKNNADYFPHQTTLRNHRKIKILRNRFGSVLGYAFWCMMLEWLTEHDGLEFEYSEIEFEMFASELGVSAAEIPPMIDYCIKLELLFKSDDGFIYSESLNEELNRVFEKRKKEREKSKTRKRKVDGTFLTTSGGVSAAEIPHSRVEKSKEEKSKEDISITASSDEEQFDTPVVPITPVYKECMDIYNNFIISQTGVSAKIDSKTGAALKRIIKYLGTQAKDKTNVRAVPDAFAYIFSHYHSWDNFHQKQLTMNQIESNLINIINSIKNGKQLTRTGGTRSKYAS